MTTTKSKKVVGK